MMKFWWRVSLMLAIWAPAVVQAANVTTIYTFQSRGGGENPEIGLFMDGVGNVYGNTTRGGKYGLGTVFKYSHDGKYSVLASLRGPAGVYAADANGNCYGYENPDGIHHNVFKVTPDGQFIVLRSFARNLDLYALTLAPDGSLIGAATPNVNHRVGTLLFRISTAGAYEKLFSSNKVTRTFALVADAQGNIFGAESAERPGYVYEYSASGRFSVLYRFRGGPRDGAGPYALTFDTSGNLWGVTMQGGREVAQNEAGGSGTMFKITPGGKEVFATSMTKHSGSWPTQSLVPDGKGGYIAVGRYPSYDAPGGAIFDVDATGKLRTLHRFQGGADGLVPNEYLAPDGHGNFYGTTFGSGHVNGTIFKLTP